MQARYIDMLPRCDRRRPKTANNSVQAMLTFFYTSEEQYAEVEFDPEEYMNAYSLYYGINKAIKALDLPIRARMIGGGVYLERIDY